MTEQQQPNAQGPTSNLECRGRPLFGFLPLGVGRSALCVSLSLIDMLFSETIKMALSSLGVNKLRSSLTMTGITIGVFSVISVMTAIGALQSSIESGISFLGSNIFQFGKYPVNINASGEIKKKYQ